MRLRADIAVVARLAVANARLRVERSSVSKMRCMATASPSIFAAPLLFARVWRALQLRCLEALVWLVVLSGVASLALPGPTQPSLGPDKLTAPANPIGARGPAAKGCLPSDSSQPGRPCQLALPVPSYQPSNHSSGSAEDAPFRRSVKKMYVRFSSTFSYVCAPAGRGVAQLAAAQCGISLWLASRPSWQGFRC